MFSFHFKAYLNVYTVDFSLVFPAEAFLGEALPLISHSYMLNFLSLLGI